MSPALISIIAQFGGPILRRAVEGKLGPRSTEMLDLVLGRAAEYAKIEPGEIDRVAQQDPAVIERAVAVAVETAGPELTELYAREMDARLDLLAAEEDGPAWMRAWRPLGMYLIGFLWLWNAVLLHVANAIWKIALPPVEFAVLLQISAIYMGLYMGGHTVKATVQNFMKKGTA